MRRNRLYILLLTACTAGYLWLEIELLRGASTGNVVGICFFRHLTGIPCPSCGSTRSVLSLIHGDLSGSLSANPFGLIILSIMVISPLWILFDVIKQKSSLLKFYNKTELFLRRKYIAIPLIVLVLVNWIWNICKGV